MSTKFRDGLREAPNELFNTAVDEFRSSVIGAFRVAIENGAQRSCINCANFDEPTEQCRKYKQRPPARVIALGCPEYEDEDVIPF